MPRKPVREVSEPPLERKAWVEGKFAGGLLLRCSFSRAVPCPWCGRKRKHFWTLNQPYRMCYIPSHGFVVAKEIGPVMRANLLVCMSHMLTPADPPTCEDADDAALAPGES